MIAKFEVNLTEEDFEALRGYALQVGAAWALQGDCPSAAAAERNNRIVRAIDQALSAHCSESTNPS